MQVLDLRSCSLMMMPICLHPNSQASVLAEHDMSWVFFISPEIRKQAQAAASTAMSEYAIRCGIANLIDLG